MSELTNIDQEFPLDYRRGDGKSVFQTLEEVDITEHIKKKQSILYLPWSKAWMIVKQKYPHARFEIHKTEDGCLYWNDGRTAWVEVSMTIDGWTETEQLAVMDYKNQSIPLEKLTSADVGKSIKRCLVKCLALFGLGLSLWTGEELSSAAKQKKEEDLDDMKANILSLIHDKMEAGVQREEIYKIIESIAKNKNPNSIKDLATAEKVLKAIEKMGGK